MTTLQALYDTFLQERKFLKNVTPNTIQSYQSVGKLCIPRLASLDQSAANALIVQLREAGKTASGTNVCIRTLNAFWKWAYENEHAPARVHLRLLKTEKKVLPTYSEQHLRAIVDARPTNLNHQRVRAMFLLAVDTGARLTEIRLLKREDVLMDQRFIKLYGKGRKERIVPFSVEARRVLWTWMRAHDHAYVFATRTGTSVSLRNAERDLGTLLDKLGLPRIAMIFHSTRRTFATVYAQRGGDLFRLQSTLGHADLSTTRRYVNLTPEDLALKHGELSPLSKPVR